MNDSNLWIFKQIKKELEILKKDKKYFSSSKDFTRSCVFTFKTVFFLLVDLPRKSLSIEIENNLAVINKLLVKKTSGTKSGFCKARKKIKPKLFKEIGKKLVSLYYDKTSTGKIKRWKGFILKAIDGSILDIVNTPETEAEFGARSNQYGKTVQGMMMIEYDVLNKIITQSYLGGLSKGENTIAKDWTKNMQADELYIYDRLYPGSSLQFLHQSQGTFYVMRCKLSHNKYIKAFVESKENEKIEDWTLTSKIVLELRKKGHEVVIGMKIPVRMLRIELEKGEVEILITNLIDKETYPYQVFKGLYFKRWGVETNIGYLKNVLQIEISSGRRVESIYQDFYATIFRANVQAIIEQDCEEQLNEINKDRKYNYQINKTVAAGILKGRMATMFLVKRPKRKYAQIKELFVKNIEPIRPNRSFSRKVRQQKLNGKYRLFTNYKKAV